MNKKIGIHRTMKDIMKVHMYVFHLSNQYLEYVELLEYGIQCETHCNSSDHLAEIISAHANTLSSMKTFT